MSKFQKGDRIIFVDPSGAGHSEAVNGREYTVAYMLDDLVHTTEGVYAFADRFKLKEPEQAVLDPLDFTNLELRTLTHIAAQADALDKDVAEKTEALRASIMAKEDFTEMLTALGIALIGGNPTPQVVEPAGKQRHPLSGLRFSDLTPEQVKEHMKVGTEVVFTGTKDEAESHGIGVTPGGIYAVTEFDRWDDSVYIADVCYLFSADHDHEVLFKVV